MRRRWNRHLLACLVVLITFLYPLLAPTPHRIDRVHADLITTGMTKVQVEAIFGVPAGNYDWAEEDYSAMFRHRRFVSYRIQTARRTIDDEGVPVIMVGSLRLAEPITQTSMTWTSRHGSFTIWFDQHERVLSTNAWTDVRIVPPWQRWWKTIWKK